jgi:hypothetical protein
MQINRWAEKSKLSQNIYHRPLYGGAALQGCEGRTLTAEVPVSAPALLAHGGPRMFVADRKRSAVRGNAVVRPSPPEPPLVAICGRLPVGKGFFDVDAVLVGAAICSACCCGAVRWPLAIMLSADQVPVKSTQSRCCICGRLPVGKGFFDGDAVLVGAAICPACCRGTLRWPLAIMLSADQVPVKSTQSRCCSG